MLQVWGSRGPELMSADGQRAGRECWSSHWTRDLGWSTSPYPRRFSCSSCRRMSAREIPGVRRRRTRRRCPVRRRNCSTVNSRVHLHRSCSRTRRTPRPDPTRSDGPGNVSFDSYRLLRPALRPGYSPSLPVVLRASWKRSSCHHHHHHHHRWNILCVRTTF